MVDSHTVSEREREREREIGWRAIKKLTHIEIDIIHIINL